MTKTNIGQRERLTQNRIVKLLNKTLGYEYLGNLEDRPDNSNIEKDKLTKFLQRQGYSQSLIEKALWELSTVSENQNKDLFYVNQEVYSLLRYGVKVKESIGENNQDVWLIDWKNPEKNDFYVAEEVTIQGEHEKRPDVVLYVNGIALGVLELKRSTISVSEGIRQNIDNQKAMFIKNFFSTIQLVMAGNDTEGLRYGTTETPEKHYYTWKETSEVENLLDRSILQLCNKARLLEVIHDFIIFDSGNKKLCRHNQYFGVKSAQKYLKQKEGGIIWHTQGSGKSLTMVWLAKWIRENITNSRVLVITDREELDDQIESIFKGVNEDIKRAKSGQDLITMLNTVSPWLMCSLVHKFGRQESEEEVNDFIQELKRSIPADFQAKGDIYVFVDECHRTQSGKLHSAMKELLPTAVFIGFTGTPLLKKDKGTSLETFGNYIHTYKYDEAVKDKVILDLKYESRYIEQNISSPEKIDQWFESKTFGLTDFAKSELKKRWGTLKNVLSSKSRLEKIVSDILLDMGTKDRLMSGRGNALLVSGSIYEACKYYELFQQTELAGKCAIITSYNPDISSVKGESVSPNEVTEKLQQYEIYQKMLQKFSPIGRKPGETEVEGFERMIKNRFKEEPGQMKLLIVVDKLLTGFDAPSATYMYIDKSMQDHRLFQAICRVNRLDGDDKEYGNIIDYKDLFKSLEKAVDDYTSEAFADFDKKDVEGLLSNRLTDGRKELDQALESISALCEPIQPPKESNDFINFFCGDTEDQSELKENEQKRVTLYKMVSHLIRSYANIANDILKAGYSSEQSIDIKHKVEYYDNVRSEIKLASGDYIDLKVYEPGMRYLIDSYINAEESKKLSAFDELTLVDLLISKGEDAINSLPNSLINDKVAVASAIENNVRCLIVEEMPSNPKYFEKMSDLLDEIIKKRKREAADYQAYLAQIIELSKLVKHPESSSDYPSELNTSAKRALYDNLKKDSKLAKDIDELIKKSKKDSWRENIFKQRELKNAIRPLMSNFSEEEFIKIFEIIKNQDEY